MSVSRILVGFTIASLLSGTSILAQWPAYPDSKVPRTADGRPNFDAPTPRTADGKPDLSGVWLNEWFYGGQVKQPPVSPPGEPPASTFANIGAGFPERPSVSALGQGADGEAEGAEQQGQSRRPLPADGTDAVPRAPAAAPDDSDARRPASSSTKATPASGRSSPTADRFRTTTLSPGGTATRPANGKATRSSSRRPGSVTMAGWISGGARSPARRRSRSDSGG